MKERSHANADPVIPNEIDSRSSKIAWSTVSNAALTSRRASNEIRSLSTEEKRSDNTRSRADSLEWCLLNPDWSFGRRPFASRYCESCRKTILSTDHRHIAGLIIYFILIRFDVSVQRNGSTHSMSCSSQHSEHDQRWLSSLGANVEQGMNSSLLSNL